MELEGVILIVGAPASGKTTICRELSGILGCPCISVSELARDEGLVSEYDDIRDTWVLDEERVRLRIEELLKSSRCLLVETVDPLAVPGPYILGIAVRCPPKELRKRLEARGYKREKVLENLEYEVVDGPLYDLLRVLELERIVEVNGCTPDVKEELDYIVDRLRSKRKFEKRFNWTTEFIDML